MSLVRLISARASAAPFIETRCIGCLTAILVTCAARLFPVNSLRSSAQQRRSLYSTTHYKSHYTEISREQARSLIIIIKFLFCYTQHWAKAMSIKHCQVLQGLVWCETNMKIEHSSQSTNVRTPYLQENGSCWATTTAHRGWNLRAMPDFRLSTADLEVIDSSFPFSLTLVFLSQQPGQCLVSVNTFK